MPLRLLSEEEKWESVEGQEFDGVGGRFTKSRNSFPAEAGAGDLMGEWLGCTPDGPGAEGLQLDSWSAEPFTHTICPWVFFK